MEILFWASFALITYVYLGYPLMLVVWSRIRRADSRATGTSGETAPSVSIVLAVRNEASRLRARVANLLAQDYDGAVEIIVVSDGSSDDPAAALAESPATVRLITLPPGGKAAALNEGVAHAHHDILVFADARQAFAPDALRHLVAPFADPRVGGVTGELLLDAERGVNDPDGAVAEGVGMYWRYEKALRRMESAVGSTLGATGAIYALRRALWRPLPPETLLDDVLAPMRAVLSGYSVVFEDRAKAFDRASRTASVESRRKVRTLAGNVQILWLEPRLLVPFVNPVWLQYLSHKVGRLLVPYALVALLVASIPLTGDHWFYELAFYGQLAFYALAIWGALLADRVARLALTFVVLNYSAVAGTVAAVMRRKVWR
jgi:biofilm PGA synthesis N-glycosyltransferase PgaC